MEKAVHHSGAFQAEPVLLPHTDILRVFLKEGVIDAISCCRLDDHVADRLVLEGVVDRDFESLAAVDLKYGDDLERKRVSYSVSNSLEV
jgi:hypothetical protein